jgi:hypothetical protein
MHEGGYINYTVSQGLPLLTVYENQVKAAARHVISG